jgi:5-methylcytosine-specific restriction endonuclease McrA
VAKEDFCFTYYDGDAARDKAHMTRLERGAYDDIISAQRKRGHLSIDDIKRVLSKDFTECWPSLEWILKKDAEEKYFIEWVDNSINQRRSWSSKSSDAGIRSARLREARKKGTHSKSEWYALLMEANGICPRCKNEVSHFDKDHVMPIYKGGSDSIQNIQPLCAKCNAEKGPEEIDFFHELRNSALNKLKTSTKLQPNFNQIANQTSTSNMEYEDEDEDGIESEIKNELAKIKIEIDELVQKNYEDRIKSNELADHFAGWLQRLGLQSKREFFVKNPGDRNDRFDLMVFDAEMKPAFIVEVKNYSRKNDYYKPLKQIGRYSKHGLPILFVPNFRTSFSRIQSCLSFFSQGITDENFVFIPESSVEEQPIDEPFVITADQGLPDATLEAAELNQFALTRNKNTEFLNHQWEVFLAERIHDPPEKRRKYQQLSDLTTYFLNWVRNKHPNGTNRQPLATGNTSDKPGTSHERLTGLKKF